MQSSLDVKTLPIQPQTKSLTLSNGFSIFLFGMLLTLSFAPFHLPGFAIISLSFFYAVLQYRSATYLKGFLFGLGYFSAGISWIYVSIHQYGNLNIPLSAFLTLLFIGYLALFPMLAAFFFRLLFKPNHSIQNCFLFAAAWVASEWLRSTLFTGFPWLAVGFGQFDSPAKFLFPVLGVYGASLWACLAAGLLCHCIQWETRRLQYQNLVCFILLILSPLCLKPISWYQENTKTPLSTAVIQANLSMRDKWSQSVFESLLQHYLDKIDENLGVDIIVTPESAIPLPNTYLQPEIEKIDREARLLKSAILLGIPKESDGEEDHYYNALMAFGTGEGNYLKQHLVPFGEYVPNWMGGLMRQLSLPESNLLSGKSQQRLIRIKNHPIASLICYELAYASLLRTQLPQAEWIVSVSDSGWFGHSLAMYQQQQMAQVRSLQSARYQIHANNDGLSSIITPKGDIQAALPALTAGTLKGTIFPIQNETPWTHYGDVPILFLTTCILLIQLFLIIKSTIAGNQKRRYPYQPNRKE